MVMRVRDLHRTATDLNHDLMRQEKMSEHREKEQQLSLHVGLCFHQQGQILKPNITVVLPNCSSKAFLWPTPPAHSHLS